MSLHPEEISEFMSDKLPRFSGAIRTRSSLLPSYFLRNTSRRSRRSLLWLVIGLPSLLVFCYVFVYEHTYPARPPDVRPRVPRHHRIPKPGSSTRLTTRSDALPVLPVGTFVHLDEYGLVDKEDLSVLLPVDNSSLVHLPSLIAPFFIDSNRPGQIIIACPSDILDEAKSVAETTLTTLRNDAVDVQVQEWPADLDPEAGLLHVGAQAEGDWVLILDTKGLQELDAEMISALLSPNAVPWPVGPRGFAFSPTELKCLTPDSDFPSPAAFLVPPFVISLSLLHNIEDGIHLSELGIWLSVGAKAAGVLESTIGGLVISQHAGLLVHDADWCQRAEQQFAQTTLHDSDHTADMFRHELYRAFVKQPDDINLRSLHFAVILPDAAALTLLSSTLCRLSDRGHTFNVIIIQGLVSTNTSTRYLSATNCHLHYDLLSDFMSITGTGESVHYLPHIRAWLSVSAAHADVALYTTPGDGKSLLGLYVEEYFASSETPSVGLPLVSLEQSEWMGELTLQEWRNWNVPKIELNVITDDRPTSLRRLLSSLDNAVYFGDHPRLTIHMEQTANPRTHAICRELNWKGDLLLRHRVVHGGLLPAVVESWYPSDNDSYGVFLEDDVEVSPMFYAWLKFTILRYRYGTHPNKSDRLFGISLYQPKYLELRPEGRRPFNATSIFSDSGVRYPFTPYLSQVPCSWGAAYFPEHWREFHSYVTLRRSEAGHLLPNDLVENVRSSKWTRSWKRYFIELAYLRGYVMLYPNYDHFVSFSTNHLEFGTHMHDLPERALAKKRAQFQVPLMAPDTGVRLLDLPQGQLPLWDELPVLDLWGDMSTQDELVLRGAYRHEDVTECKRVLDITGVSTYNAMELLCLQDEAEEDDLMDNILDDLDDEDEDEEILF